MGLFGNKQFDTLEDLACQQLEDLYDAEQRLIQALPNMAKAAHSPQLKKAFDQHHRETQGHVSRLEDVFRKLGKSPSRETCQAMKGLIAEGEEMVQANGDPDVKDAALVAAAQRVEHYEIAGYGTARSLLERLGHGDAAQILQETLNEEKHADQHLTELAEQAVNPAAAHN